MSEPASGTSTVGFIGLGHMGHNMALRLLDCGVPLLVTDANPDAARSCIDAGATWAPDAATVARGCTLILSSLPGPAQVESVSLGANGLLEGLQPGTLYIDLSTSSPTLIRRIDEAFGARGSRAIDAPVSGGEQHCRTGTLTIFMGGDADVTDRAKAILDHLAKNLVHVGPLGSGAIVKILNNAVGLSTLSLLSEVISLGVKAGCDHRSLYEALRQGAYGQGLYLTHMLPEVAFRHKYDPPSFALTLGRKDLGLAVDLGRELQVPMPLVSSVEQGAIEMMARGHAEHDAAIIFSLQELRSSVPLHDADALDFDL